MILQNDLFADAGVQVDCQGRNQVGGDQARWPRTDGHDVQNKKVIRLVSSKKSRVVFGDLHSIIRYKASRIHHDKANVSASRAMKPEKRQLFRIIDQFALL